MPFTISNVKLFEIFHFVHKENKEIYNGNKRTQQTKILKNIY